MTSEWAWRMFRGSPARWSNSSFSVAENTILGYQNASAYNGKVAMKKSRIREICAKLMREFDVRPQSNFAYDKFIGGTALVLARELHQQPEILLVGQPTRGVDIGAIEFLHQQIIEKRDEGAAIILVSVELDGGAGRPDFGDV